MMQNKIQGMEIQVIIYIHEESKRYSNFDFKNIFKNINIKKFFEFSFN